jgi:hypothetical protein
VVDDEEPPELIPVLVVEDDADGPVVDDDIDCPANAAASLIKSALSTTS